MVPGVVVAVVAVVAVVGRGGVMSLRRSARLGRRIPAAATSVVVVVTVHAVYRGATRATPTFWLHTPPLILCFFLLFCTLPRWLCALPPGSFSPHRRLLVATWVSTSECLSQLPSSVANSPTSRRSRFSLSPLSPLSFTPFPSSSPFFFNFEKFRTIHRYETVVTNKVVQFIPPRPLSPQF